ncbi:MAG TPA: ankyrin repeat domain-containing protein [Phycisphaerales bacterium]|nr:ankyrin repeat domain-containing protein [Phycisphaerales bacterium]
MSARGMNPAVVVVALLLAAGLITVFIIKGGGGPKQATGESPSLPAIERPGIQPMPSPQPIAYEAPEEPAPEDRPSGEMVPVEVSVATVLPALISAAADGDTDRVRALIDGGEAVDQRDDNGRTALIASAAGGHMETVFALLDAGADPMAKDDRGLSARDHAIARADEAGLRLAKVLEGAIAAVVGAATDQTK